MASPPTLPIPRQPSPLSFSITSDDNTSPVPSPISQHASLAPSTTSLPRRPVSDMIVEPPPQPEAGPSRLSPVMRPPRSRPLRHAGDHPTVPIKPVPDSLLYRSTISHLDGQTYTLKRLSKSVLAHSGALVAALEAVERAEDEFIAILTELARFLEGGFGGGGDVWADDGLRKMRRDKWARQRDEVRGMVEQGVAAVRGDLKRWGLAGGSAQTRFDRTSKQYYDQTSSYLSHADSSSSHSHQHSISATTTTPSSHTPHRQNSSTSAEAEQAARTASFDLARYSHHSTLLYAVPPSSISCLDLLVNIYWWAGGMLGDQSGGTAYGDTAEAYASTPSLIPQTPRPAAKSSPTRVGQMKEDVASSLSYFADTRVELLDAWAKRNEETRRLEDDASRLQSKDAASVVSTYERVSPPSASSHGHTGLGAGVGVGSSTGAGVGAGMNGTPISSSGVEFRKTGGGVSKMHKLQRSVGGKLRDLLTSSSSTARDLHLLAGVRSGDKSARNSFDVSVLTGPGSAPGKAAMTSAMEHPPPIIRAGASAPASASVLRSQTDGVPRSAPLLPPGIQDASSPPFPAGQFRRPSMPTRHSTQFTAHENSPFLVVDPSLFPLSGNGYGLSPPASPLEDQGLFPPTDDSPAVKQVVDDKPEEVGRKKEGVLWGAGSWEEMGKGAKGKWEKYWVVLDHSSIYEYRDTDSGRPESAHAVIDLKFASVREGRGTERRFVFEIVTPTKGRRLYQATSEAEMQQWVHAICNAIESVIQGISSVRTFDTSKLRTLSGAYDDHALPIRQKLGFPVPGIPARANGFGTTLGGGLASIPGSPSRRSMPPPNRHRADGPSSGPLPLPLPLPLDGRRKRQTSFKQALKQSAEAAGERLRDAVGPHYARLSPDIVQGSNNTAFLAPMAMDRGHSGSSYSGVSSASSAHVHMHETSVPASAISTPSPEARNRTSGSGIKLLDSGTEEGDRSVGSWYEVDADGDIEKRVMEMVGLGVGVGIAPSPSAPLLSSGREDRRVKSEGKERLKNSASGQLRPSQPGRAGLMPGGGEITRSRSAEVPFPVSGAASRPAAVAPEGRGRLDAGRKEGLTMEVLRKTASLPENSMCADCGRSSKASRWASISLRDTPMVIFLCIKCCGIHRSFGTHISKPRSVDLDIWTPESIALAVEWGNLRANQVWEAGLADGERPTREEDMPEFVRRKYVEGTWLSDELRTRFGLGS